MKTFNLELPIQDGNVTADCDYEEYYISFKNFSINFKVLYSTEVVDLITGDQVTGQTEQINKIHIVPSEIPEFNYWYGDGLFDNYMDSVADHYRDEFEKKINTYLYEKHEENY